MAVKQPAAQSGHGSGRQRGSWVLDPGCLAPRAHRAGPILKTLQVVGSSPWLFEPILASRTAARRKSSRSVAKTPVPTRRGIFGRERSVSRTASTRGKTGSRTGQELRESSQAARTGRACARYSSASEGRTGVCATRQRAPTLAGSRCEGQHREVGQKPASSVPPTSRCMQLGIGDGRSRRARAGRSDKSALEESPRRARPTEA